MSAGGVDGGVTRVLMVCSGNICRSPLAELLLKQTLGQSPSGQTFEVLSAGTIAIPGQRMPEEAVRVAMSYDIAEADARAHRATRLTEQYVKSADLVLGMTREHRAAAVTLVPQALRRSFTLREFARLATAQGNMLNRASRQTLGGLITHLATQRVAAVGDPIQDDVADPWGQTSDAYVAAGEVIGAAVTVVGQVMG